MGPNKTICEGNSTPISALGSNGASPYTYSWSPTAGLSNPNIANPVASPGSTTTYTCLVTDATSCTATGTLQVTVNPLPSVNMSAAPSFNICKGKSVTLSASGANTYIWNTGATSPNIIVAPAVSTTYTVTGTNTATNCKNKTTGTVNVDLPTTISIGGAGPICFGKNAVLTASGVNTYTWSTGEFTNSITVAPTVTTTYSVSGMNTASTCTNTATASGTVIVNLLPPVSAGIDQTIIEGTITTLAGTGALTYFWTPVTTLTNQNTASPFAEPIDSISYFLQGIDANGCEKKDTMVVYVIHSNAVVIYNAFTPNGDGTNDFFYIGNIRKYSESNLEVFNRNGMLVIQKSPYLNDWDGKSEDGSELPCATYYYVLTLETGAAQKHGSVTIIR